MQLTITGQVPAQKNNKQIVYNKKTNKPFIMSSQKVKEWQNLASIQLLKYQIKEPFSSRVKLSVMFYVKDNRRRDSDNMLSSIQDLLVTSGILQDDSWQYVCIGTVDAQIDAHNPRAEIQIEELDNT